MFFPQNKCFIASERIRLICAWLLAPKPSLLPRTCCTSFFAVTREAGLRNPFGWKILPSPPTVLAVSSFPSLVLVPPGHTGSWSRREQWRLGASFFPWHGQLCQLQGLTELQSRRRDQYLQMADQSTSAPSLGASVKLFEVRRQESMSLHPESTPRSPGRRKV